MPSFLPALYFSSVGRQFSLFFLGKAHKSAMLLTFFFFLRVDVSEPSSPPPHINATFIFPPPVPSPFREQFFRVVLTELMHLESFFRLCLFFGFFLFPPRRDKHPVRTYRCCLICSISSPFVTGRRSLLLPPPQMSGGPSSCISFATWTPAGEVCVTELFPPLPLAPYGWWATPLPRIWTAARSGRRSSPVAAAGTRPLRLNSKSSCLNPFSWFLSRSLAFAFVLSDSNSNFSAAADSIGSPLLPCP